MLLHCNSLRTSPPPAVAGAQAKQAKDDLQRCGRVTQLLRQSVKDFAAAAGAYGRLHESSFDADPDSLAHLQLLQQLCSCVGQWIEMVCLRGNLQGDIYQNVEVEFAPILPEPMEEYSIEVQVGMLSACGIPLSNFMLIAFYVFASSTCLMSISDLFANCFLRFALTGPRAPGRECRLLLPRPPLHDPAAHHRRPHRRPPPRRRRPPRRPRPLPEILLPAAAEHQPQAVGDAAAAGGGRAGDRLGLAAAGRQGGGGRGHRRHRRRSGAEEK